MPSHSYEEIRGVAIDVLLKALPAGPFGDFQYQIGQRLLQRHGKWPLPPGSTGIGFPGMPALLHPDDIASIQEVFWDLFRQGAITLCSDVNQPGWPGYRLTRFGKHIAEQSPFRFHDTHSYISMVKGQTPDLSTETETYLEEAVAAFYADCLLASTIMLGVAAEAEFLCLLNVAAGGSYAPTFAPVTKPPFIRQKITAFQKAVRPILPSLSKDVTEDLDTNLLMIQSVLRIARNDAGHPSGAASPSREQVYTNLQLFVPYARQLMSLRGALK